MLYSQITPSVLFLPPTPRSPHPRLAPSRACPSRLVWVPQRRLSPLVRWHPRRQRVLPELPTPTHPDVHRSYAAASLRTPKRPLRLLTPCPARAGPNTGVTPALRSLWGENWRNSRATQTNCLILMLSHNLTENFLSIRRFLFLCLLRVLLVPVITVLNAR